MAWRRALLALGLIVAGHCVVAPAALSAPDIACDSGDLEVVRVGFSGNTAFTDAQLANGIVTTPSTWARRVFRILGTRHCLDTAEVRRDPIRLLVLYSRHGFTGTRVSSRVDTVRAGRVASSASTAGPTPQPSCSTMDGVPSVTTSSAPCWQMLPRRLALAAIPP